MSFLKWLDNVLSAPAMPVKENKKSIICSDFLRSDWHKTQGHSKYQGRKDGVFGIFGFKQTRWRDEHGKDVTNKSRFY